MSFREFVAGELIDIIEWFDESADTMAARFQRPRNEIKNGAQLIVRPGQLAAFVDQGRVADVFPPGRHTLATANLPVLSRLRGWKYGFESPFKAEVIFVNTKQFTNRKWGTGNPVIVRDPELGPVRLRAFGTYAVSAVNPPRFIEELMSTNSVFIVDEIAEQLRNMVVSSVSTALASGQITIIELARQYAELGKRVQDLVAPQFEQYGLEITQLVVENVSVPAEVEAAIDQRAKMNVLGNLDQYARLQAADALREAARNPSGGAAAGVGIGMGAAMAHQAMSRPQSPSASPGGSEPPPIPTDAWFYVENGERRGPVNAGVLRQHMASGAVTRDTLVWKQGMSEWVAASTVPELGKPAGA